LLLNYDIGSQRNVMKLVNLPIGVVDWSRTPAVIQAGEIGTATARTWELGDITLRLVVYSSGFKSDHWCNKGHIVYVVSGSFVIEHEDETRTELSAGKSWHAPDDAGSPHRVLCEAGATVFILD
jgi:quercetin dioxygenase-like cupin family protein